MTLRREEEHGVELEEENLLLRTLLAQMQTDPTIKMLMLQTPSTIDSLSSNSQWSIPKIHKSIFIPPQKNIKPFHSKYIAFFFCIWLADQPNLSYLHMMISFINEFSDCNDDKTIDNIIQLFVDCIVHDVFRNY